MLHRFCLVLCCLAAASCANLNPSTTANTDPNAGGLNAAEQVLLPAQSLALVERSTSNAEVYALWERAEQAFETSDYRGAVDLLGRALELDAREAAVLSRYAEAQLRLGDFAKGEQAAMSSNRYAGSDRALRYRNWSMVHYARESRGNTVGAKEALRRLQLLNS